MMARHGVLWAFLIIVNLLGVAYGYLYYSDQLAATSPLFWPFIPDSPLAVLLFAIALAIPLRSQLFDFIVAVGLVKIGLWTNMVFLLFSNYFIYSSSDRLLLTLVLGALHVGMIAEAGIVLPRAISRRTLALALCWFLLNDFIDYGLGQHPYLPPGQLGLTALLTIALTLGITFALYRLSSKIRRPFMGRIQTLYD